MFEEIPRICQYAYLIVSLESQKDNSFLESQKQKLLKQGISEKNIWVEVGSAANPIQEHPIFLKSIEEKLQKNDLLNITKIDRCSRNTREPLKLQERLYKKRVRFISLNLPCSNEIAINQLILTNLATIMLNALLARPFFSIPDRRSWNQWFISASKRRFGTSVRKIKKKDKWSIRVR